MHLKYIIYIEYKRCRHPQTFNLKREFIFSSVSIAVGAGSSISSINN